MNTRGVAGEPLENRHFGFMVRTLAEAAALPAPPPGTLTCPKVSSEVGVLMEEPQNAC